MPLPPIRLPSPYGSDRLVQLAPRLRPALCDTLITVGSQEFPGPQSGASRCQPAAGPQGARGDRAKEPDPGLKKHQEKPEKPSWNPERKLGDQKQKPEQASPTGGREQILHKQAPPRGTSEKAGTAQEAQGEQMRSKENRLQAPVGQRGADGKQGVLMWVRENPGGSKESLWEFPSPFPPAGVPQTSVTPRLRWAEASWLVGDQPALWSILLVPPGYGTPFSHSAPTTGAWQEVWQDHRIPLSLNAPKGLWSQNQLASSSPTPGSLPKGPTQLSPGEMEESDQGHTGVPATCAGHEGKAGCPPRPHLPPAPPARSRPYVCSVCGKRFSLKHQMETHYQVHTGEKPFSCSLCPQRSRDFSAMTKHLQTHGAAPYRCPLCGAGCSSLASMQAHMRSHSPSQLPPGWTIRSTFLYSSRPSWPSISLCCPPSSTT
uniref:C2H2-type domain-containing protein n=1 Tax=Saimiri boliviensis boliviensis TaxID=39432 RepID=A0A2K6UXA7_SAIBB